MAGNKVKAPKVEEDVGIPDMFTNRLQVDATLQKFFAEKGLAFRWINITKYRSERFHRTGWTPYKRDESTPMSAADSVLGVSPDGFIIRGDNVLAIKPVAQARAYKQYLQDRTSKNTGATQKAAAAAIRSSFKASGIDAKVEEGFDEDEK